MVRTTNDHDNRDVEIASEEKHRDGFDFGLPSADQAPQTGRLSCYWERYRRHELDGTSIELVQASWRGKTERDYSYKWNRWVRYCRSRRISETCPTLGEALNFLSHLYRNGLKWRTIGGYRSALSMTLPMYDGLAFGKHPLVTRLVKGVFNKRPPIKTLFPKWSVKKVLEELEKWSPTRHLDLKKLTFKTLFLLALSTGRRQDSIALLSTKKGYFEISELQARLQPIGLEKESRPEHIAPPIVINSFMENRRLCPVYHLKTYIKRTSL